MPNELLECPECGCELWGEPVCPDCGLPIEGNEFSTDKTNSDGTSV